MADRNLTLGVQTDEKSIGNAKKRLTEIQKELKGLDKGFKSGKVSTQQYTQEVSRLSKEQLALSNSLDKGTTGAAKAEKELVKLEAAQRKLVAAFRDGKISAEQFNSSLGRIQGRAGVQQQALGAALPSEGGGRSGRGLLGEIGTAVRNAPAIPIPGTGITSEPIAKAAIGLDRAGLSVQQLGTAALIAAPIIVALAVATKDWARQAQEITSVIEAQRKVGQDIATGLGTEEAQSRIAELDKLLADESSRLERNKALYDEAIADVNELGDSLLGAITPAASIGPGAGGEVLVGAIQAAAPQEQALADAIDESTALTEGYRTEQESLQRALEDGQLAANDAAEAEKKLAEERTKATLAQASAAGDLVRAQKEAEELTRGEAAERVDSLKDQAAALQAELGVLKASGDTSDEVAKQIASLEAQIKSLGDQAGVFQKVASSSTPTVKELAAQQEAQAKEAERAARETEKAAKAEQNAAKKISSTRQKSVDEAQKQAEKLADIEQKFRDDELKLRRATADKREDEAINLARDIEDITRDARRDRKRSLAEGDFLGLNEINNQERDAKADAILDSRRANMDITRDAQRAHRELVINAENQRRDIVAVTQDMHRQTLGMTANWATSMTAIFRNFFEANTRFTQSRARMFSNAPATPG